MNCFSFSAEESFGGIGGWQTNYFSFFCVTKIWIITLGKCEYSFQMSCCVSSVWNAGADSWVSIRPIRCSQNAVVRERSLLLVGWFASSAGMWRDPSRWKRPVDTIKPWLSLNTEARGNLFTYFLLLYRQQQMKNQHKMAQSGVGPSRASRPASMLFDSTSPEKRGELLTLWGSLIARSCGDPSCPSNSGAAKDHRGTAGSYGYGFRCVDSEKHPWKQLISNKHGGSRRG